MQKRTRVVGLILFLFAFVVLFANLSKPRIGAMHGSDIVGLIACGACFGVGAVGLLGRLRINDYAGRQSLE